MKIGNMEKAIKIKKEIDDLKEKLLKLSVKPLRIGLYFSLGYPIYIREDSQRSLFDAILNWTKEDLEVRLKCKILQLEDL